MTVGKLTKPYHGRRGAPSTIELRFWTDATKTVGRDMTAISAAWLAELRANPTDTSPAATFSIDDTGAVGSAGVPGVLTLSLDADVNTGLLLGRASRTLGWDLVALDTDTPIVTGTYVVDGAYTHPGSDASPTSSTALGIYDVYVLGDATTTLIEVDIFSGPEGPPGPPGGVNSVDGQQGDIDLSGDYVPAQPTAPDHTIADGWLDTSVSPPVLRGWNGTAWITIGGTGATIDDATAAGTTVYSSSHSETRFANRAAVQYIDALGGDNTGAAPSDSAFSAALAALPTDPITGYPMGTIRFGVGRYRINSPLGNIGPRVVVEGMGRRSTYILFYGTGNCLRLYSSWFYTGSYNVPAETGWGGGGFRKFTVDGTNAGNGSTGIRYGDTVRPVLDDVAAENFSGTNSVGICQVNTVTWTEKTRADVYVLNNTTNYLCSVDFADDTTTVAQAATLPSATIKLAAWKPSFARPVGDGSGPKPNIYVDGQVITYTGYTINGDNTATLTGCAGGTGSLTVGDTVQFGSGGGSHAYCKLRIDVGALPNQDGLAVINGANLYSGAITLRGNFSNSTSVQTSASLRVGGPCPTGTRLAGGNAQIIHAQLDVQLEVYGPGTNVPQTININGTGPNKGYLRSCYGVMRWGGTWGQSNITQSTAAQLRFLGFIIGDTTLNGDTTSAPGPTARGPLTFAAVASNPATLQLNFNDGDFCDINLTPGSSGQTVSFNNPPACPQRKTVVMHQPSSGGTYNITFNWPTSGSPSTTSPNVIWPNNTAPVMSSGISATDVYHLITLDGATWYAYAEQGVITTGPGSSAQLSGAANPTRYVGRHDGGPPTSGAFVQGDFILDATDGTFWICQTAGSPGSWVNSSAAVLQSGLIVPQRTKYGLSEWIGAATLSTSTTQVVGTSGVLFGVPVALSAAGTPVALGLNVTNVGSGASITFALRKDDGTVNPTTATLLGSTSLVSLGSAGFIQSPYTTPITAPGMYWVEALIQWSTTAPTVSQLSGQAIGLPRPASGASFNGYRCTGLSSIPSSLPTSGGTQWQWSNLAPDLLLGI